MTAYFFQCDARSKKKGLGGKKENKSRAAAFHRDATSRISGVTLCFDQGQKMLLSFWEVSSRMSLDLVTLLSYLKTSMILNYHWYRLKLHFETVVWNQVQPVWSASYPEQWFVIDMAYCNMPESSNFFNFYEKIILIIWRYSNNN